MCETLGVTFEMKVTFTDTQFVSAIFYMNKIGSLLQGMKDFSLGKHDREHVVSFNWIDAIQASKQE